MSRRNNGYYGSRRTSKIIWISFGFLVLVLLVFPYFVDNIRALISSSLYSLGSIGATLQTIGMICFFLGLVLAILPILGGRSFWRSSFKILIIGVVLIILGIFLNNPFDITSLFGGGANNRGYHILL